jgi:hypothetical protein
LPSVAFFSLTLSLAGPAAACPYSPSSSGAAGDTVAVDATAATHCARSAALIGGNCSYSTGMMARRVMEEGAEWSSTGALAGAADAEANPVAVPFVAADGALVIANELLELLVTSGRPLARASYAGRALDVDGVRYVVLTSYQLSNR